MEVDSARSDGVVDSVFSVVAADVKAIVTSALGCNVVVLLVVNGETGVTASVVIARVTTGTKVVCVSVLDVAGKWDVVLETVPGESGVMEVVVGGEVSSVVLGSLVDSR